jgi:hypothetical protein
MRKKINCSTDCLDGLGISAQEKKVRKEKIYREEGD